MPTRKASATWEGGFKGGKGSFDGEGGTIGGTYTAGSRFDDSEKGTNPEELLAAAHASCFSMALAAQLGKAGYEPIRISTDAACTVEKVGEGFTITTMRLTSRAQVPGIDNNTFQEIAAGAKEGCPVSRALAGVKVDLEITLE
jgi:osmotically inducible protein OsmC